MPRGETSFKVVRWVLGTITEAMPRLRKSLTGVFIGTPSDNAADIQGNGGGVPACGVAWAVDPDTHGGAMFVVADAFPAEYVEAEKKIYMLDSLGKRHAGARPLIVGKNVELAAGVIGDAQGTVSRGAEFGDAKRGGVKLGNNVFYPAAGQLIAHHLQPDPPKQSTQCYDVDGRKAGIHYQWRVVEWVKAFCQGATGVAEKVFAVALNMTRNGDGTAAHGIAVFKGGKSFAALSNEAGGPLKPADDRNHVLGETGEGLIHQGANDIDVLYGPIRKLYGPEELVDEQWEDGGKGPYVKRVEKRPDFEAKHTNACGDPAPLVIKFQTWDDWNTYPTYPRFPEVPPPIVPPPGTPIPPEDGTPRNVFPQPDPVPKKDRLVVNTTVDFKNAPPVTSTPNEIGVPSEYGEPVPGTPEPRVPVPQGISRFMVGHNFTEEERVKQGRVGHSVYAPVYKSNTAGSGDTAAKRWPVSYTSEGKLYVAANGRVLAIERPYYASGAKITLAPEMERQHQFVANKETWPTTLSAFYTIFGAGKNAAGVEFIGGLGMGLRVPNSYLPASGFAIKLVYTDSITTPHIDIVTTDANGLVDGGAGGQELRFNGASIGGGSGDVVGPASATDNAVARFDSTTGKLIQNSSFIVEDISGSAMHMHGPDNASPVTPTAVVLRSGNATGGTVDSGNTIIDTGTSGGGTAGTVQVGVTTANAVEIGRSGKTTTISGNFALPDDDVQVSEGGTGASTAPTALSNLGGFGTPIALANLAMM